MNNSLQSCAGDPSRILHRLRAILEGGQIRGQPAGDSRLAGIILPGHHLAVISAYLGCAEENRQVVLHMCPADTLEQARVFYLRTSELQQLLALQDGGWEIRPNFHFGFMIKGLCWTTPSASTGDYIRHWQTHISETRRVDRSDWPTFWNELVNLGFAHHDDKEKFDRDFTHTRRRFADPRPGVYCRFAWILAEAEALDNQGRFSIVIKERINELLVALGEPAV